MRTRRSAKTEQCGTKACPTRSQQRGRRRREMAGNNHTEQNHKRSVLAIVGTRAANLNQKRTENGAKRGAQDRPGAAAQLETTEQQRQARPTAAQPRTSEPPGARLNAKRQRRAQVRPHGASSIERRRNLRARRDHIHQRLGEHVKRNHPDWSPTAPPGPCTAPPHHKWGQSRG